MAAARSSGEEAVEAPPWRAGDGPPPRVHTYPYGERPLLDIRIAGEWRRCLVRARYDWPTGHVSYQVEVTRPVKGGVETVVRAYWWDAAVMRRPADGGGVRT